MKIYLDNNLGVTNVEQEELTQDTIGYNILKVYIPNAVLTPYNVFTCYYGALLQNGRKVGWFAMEARTSSDADYKANYTLYKATLEQCVVSVEGKVYIGCQVLLGNSGNATLIKKNTAVVQFNVRKSVAINNDILVLDTDQTTTDVLESYKNLLENALTTYATKATTYTKTEVNSALALKADKSDTYTKIQVDVKDLNLAAQMASDKLELNNRINTTNNILVETNAKVASLETDVDTLQNNTYSKTEVDEKIDDISAYTKSEIDTMINAKADKTTVEGINTRVGALETDIADLKSVQNVVDVVATKSALNSYDTTKLDVNDKVQVIADETHDGASTIYNWNGSAWQYVGAFGGNSYTKQESDNKFALKSTAVTHTGNQLKDKDGNNIYPNLDAKTQAKIDNAYGPAYVGKDTSAHILAFTTNKGIYIGTDNGYWYYWNGSQYADGGVYQATQIADNSILPSMTKFFTPRGINLFNKWTVILGYFRGSWDGVLHENSAYYASDFIPVNAETTYSFKGVTANAHISYFDISKTYLSGEVSLDKTTLTTPANCAYVCISDQKIKLDTLEFEENNSNTTAIYDYYKIISNMIKIEDMARVIIVDASGKNGAFKSLAKACDYASSGDTILVMPGEYIDESCMCWNKKINIIGVNKDTCKIATSISTYQSPMFNMQIGMIANLSILLSAGDGYCIHSEHTDQVDNTLIIKNCNIISNTGTCIGCGMRKGYSLIIENCYIENKSNGACVLIHDAYDEQYIGDMYPTIINCELISNEVPCLVIQSQEKDGTIVHLTIEKTSMITNATHTYRVVNYEGGTSSNPDDFLGCINWRLDKRSWGNSEDTYNYEVSQLTGAIDGKSTVIANPTLAGTEPDLTGLEVDGTKYKVGGGSEVHLYQHHISIGNTTSVNTTRGCFEIYNDNNTPFSDSTLAKYIYDLGFVNGGNSYYPIPLVVDNSNVGTFKNSFYVGIQGVLRSGTYINRVFEINETGQLTNNISALNIVDIITQIF